MNLRRIAMFAALGLTILFATPLQAAAIDSGATTGYKKGLEKVGGEGSTTDLTDTIRNIINTLLFVAGISAVVIIVVAGIRFITAEGDSNGTNRARHTIIYASIGLVVAASSFAVVNFVLDQL